MSPDGWSTSKIEDGLRVLERIRRQVDSASAALVAAMPQSRDSVTALVRITGVSASEARRRRIIAAVVSASPIAARLLAAGLLSSEHVAALGPIREYVEDLTVIALAAVGKLPEDVRDEVEHVRLSHLAGSDASARQRTMRRLVISAGPEGMIAIRGLLPPLEGAMFESLLRSAMDANWRHDHPERARTLGGQGGDTRDQRRLDALLQLLGITPAPPPPESATAGVPSTSSGARTRASERSGGTDERRDDRANCAGDRNDDRADRGSRDSMHADNASVGDSSPPCDSTSRNRPTSPSVVRIVAAKPSVVIVFDIDRYQAELLGHGPIPVTSALFDATKADLFYFFQNGHGEVLKFGRAKRDPTAIQRLAVEVRDRHCIYPHCRAPASRCQVHHLNEWLIDHGFTDVEVLGLFCDPHHRHLHLEELVAERQSDAAVIIRIRSTGETIATARSIH